jgi:hypothetical protein
VLTDTPDARAATRPRRRAGLAVAAALVSFSAAAGAVGLISGALTLGEIIQRVPLESPVLAGVALAVSVAVPFGVLSVHAARRSPRTDQLAVLAGAALVGWIVVQVLVIRTFSWFQPTYLAIGLLFVRAGRHGGGRR